MNESQNLQLLTVRNEYEEF